MKTIAIISPDTVPLPIQKDAPEMITLREGEFSLRDKCCRATSLGVRAWKMAEQLSKHFKVTLLIPDINFPGNEYIDTSRLFCDVAKYDYELSLDNLEPRLQRKLTDYDVTIVQSNSGAAFWNCAFLPERHHLIIDGWTLLPVELPLSLLGYDEVYKKKVWDDLMLKFYSLIKRGDCILYNADPHKYYYEGLLFHVGKSNWDSVDKSNLIKLSFGVDKNEKIQRNTRSSNLKLLWYGPVYPWYDPETLIKAVSEIDNIELDFYAIRHPRFSKSYHRLYESVFKSIDCPRISVNLDYQDKHWNLYKNYDAGVLLSKEGLESMFSLRIRTIDMISYGLPVLSNDSYPFGDTLDLENIVYPISRNNLKEELSRYAGRKAAMYISEESFSLIQQNLSWESTTKELVNYIGNL